MTNNGLSRAALAAGSFMVMAAVGAALVTAAEAVAAEAKPSWPAGLQLVLDRARPLDFPRGDRLPLYLWPAMNPGPLDDAAAVELVRELDRRGVGLVCRWDWGGRRKSLPQALAVARAQKKLGLRINVDATSCLSSFFNGDERTAHVGKDGKPFWDDSFGRQGMGCPLTLDSRCPALRERVAYFADAYAAAGLDIGFCFADWEVDGPLEWNRAWDAARRCQRCRRQIPGLDNFLAYQKTVRDLRSRLQREVYAEPLLARFPSALVGNYAVYPHDGFRYWYDYFEEYVDGQPALVDQRAHYRHWANEFAGTGYTAAMPVVYTWSWTYKWYDFPVADYRWFYNMLRVASNAGQHTPTSTPIISFVHWHTTVPANPPDPELRPMSAWAYQELLWHMMLRGVDTFFLWCMEAEQAREVELLHPVWAAAQQYGEFLQRGTPVSFAVPDRPGPVVSGLRLGNRLLVRRTDFTDQTDPVELRIAGARVSIPPAKGRCRIITLDAPNSNARHGAAQNDASRPDRGGSR